MINQVKEENYPFPTFELGVKEENLYRQKIYSIEKDMEIKELPLRVGDVRQSQTAISA